MNNTNQPIFIVGAPRSGTTLLQYMLKSHPDISLPSGESHFFIPLYQRRNEFGDLNEKANLESVLTEIYRSRKVFFDEDFHGIKFDVSQLTNQLHQQGVSTVPDIISTIFQANADAEGKKYWGEKTPYYILHLATIKEMFPNAKIIHIIRDGRDCALSMLERRWDLQIFNIYHAAYTWDKYVTTGQRFGEQNTDSYFEIHYENILTFPEDNLRALCDFLSIEYSDSLIHFKKSGEKGKTPLLTQPLQIDNKQKWKSGLSKKQVQLFEAMAGKTLSDNNYEIVYPSLSISKLDWFISEVHINLCSKYCFLNRSIKQHLL